MKSKFFIAIIVLNCFCVETKAQLNIIPDGSFEDTVVGWLQIRTNGALRDWGGLNDTGFTNQWYLMSTILANIDLNLPDNPYVRNLPKYGKFAINMLPFLDTFENFNQEYLRSILRCKLNQKLIMGKQYCATIFVTASEQQGFLFTNGLGMYFDNGQLDTMLTIHKDSSGAYTNALPQVQCNFLINDTINWMKIQGSFVANGTEEYITIGNFLKDSDMLWGVEQSLGGAVFFHGQNILIDNASLIDVTVNKWLPTTYTTANADSVWVGLDAFDYADGKWYTSNMQYITTGPGFWLKGGSIEAGKKFIHEIDVCGVLRYDTTEVVVAPVAISNEQFAMNNLKVWPNPATDAIQVSNVAGDKVGLYNTVGQLVLVQNAVQNKVSMQVGHLPKGVYVVKAGGQVGRLLLK
jgi:Secretion system C-terminal sorting domain